MVKCQGIRLKYHLPSPFVNKCIIGWLSCFSGTNNPCPSNSRVPTQYELQKLFQADPGLIHLYGAGKWDNDWVREYTILGTPTYYLLDADKKIVAKTASLDQLPFVFN